MSKIRNLGAVLALALALIVPGTALAAPATGSMAETISVASTIAMVVPATVAYTVTGTTATADVSISGLETNQSTGLTVKARFSTLVSGSTIIPTTARQFQSANLNTGGMLGVSLAPGSIANITTDYTVGASTLATTGGGSHWNSIIQNLTVSGTYTGTINFTASTNP